MDPLTLYDINLIRPSFIPQLQTVNTRVPSAYLPPVSIQVSSSSTSSCPAHRKRNDNIYNPFTDILQILQDRTSFAVFILLLLIWEKTKKKNTKYWQWCPEFFLFIKWFFGLNYCYIPNFHLLCCLSGV